MPRRTSPPLPRAEPGRDRRDQRRRVTGQADDDSRPVRLLRLAGRSSVTETGRGTASRSSGAGSSRSRVSRSRAGPSCSGTGRSPPSKGRFPVPAGAEVIDAAGKWVLPGFIDAHAHAGVSEEAEGWAGQDTNERTDPVTAQVRALDAINPADLGFRDAISGGVLAVNVNPGSANPIGGQTARSSAGAAPWTRWSCASRPGSSPRSARTPSASTASGTRPVDQAGHRRGDPRRVRRGAELPGQAGRAQAVIRPRWIGTSSSRRWAGCCAGDPVAPALPSR